ncbi:MAG: DUF3810 domain-containing protein [Bacteroidota bacterium]
MKRETPISARLWVKLGLLFIIALTISLFSLFPGQVEKIYSVGIYPGLANTLRTLTRWIPVSVGDILYAWLVIWLIIRLVKGIRLIYLKQCTRERLVLFLFAATRTVLWVYIIFKLMWGLNYNRLGIAYQLKIDKKEYSKEEVTQLTDQLIGKLNECRRQIKDSVLPEPPLDTLYREAFRSYQSISLEYEFLNYRNRSVKPSLFTCIGDYMGFTGYYNPFTGEAQLRTDVPRILIPYIACHEMAHQLGYASESEANFVGYLAAAASKDVYFRYSVYLDLFSYAQGEEIMQYGKEKDFKNFEAIIKHNRESLDTLVKRDRKQIREFFTKRRNRISPAVSSLYDQYLKMNKQMEGVNSYDEVIGWLIAYQKKYGRL